VTCNGGAVYLIGGYTAGGPSETTEKRLFLYDPVADVYLPRAEVPVEVDDTLGDPHTATMDHRGLVRHDDGWATVGGMTAPRTGTTAVSALDLLDLTAPTLGNTLLARRVVRDVELRWGGDPDTLSFTPYQSLLLDLTPLRSIVHRLLERSDYSSALFQLDELRRIRRLEGGPQFVVVHLMAPHLPHTFDATGSHVSRPPYREGYRDEVVTLNRELLRAVDGIEKRNPTAIIVIQSDHGPWSDWREGMGYDIPPCRLQSPLRSEPRAARGCQLHFRKQSELEDRGCDRGPLISASWVRSSSWAS